MFSLLSEHLTGDSAEYSGKSSKQVDKGSLRKKNTEETTRNMKNDAKQDMKLFVDVGNWGQLNSTFKVIN